MLSTTINTFLLVTCIHIVTVISQGGNITCTVPPTHMFQDAVLTCNFPEDLNVTKKDFTVYHYVDHNADAVVDCWWLRGNMSCSAQPNVQYQRSVNTTFTITLVNVSSTHAGTYTCQFVDNDPKIIQKCQLEILIGGNITCTVPPTHTFQDAVLTCNFPEDLNVTKKDFTVYHYVDHNTDAVVDCWWLRGNMSCSAQPNVQYQRSVNTTFTVTLVNVSSLHAGTYQFCQFADNDPKLIQKCQLEILIAFSEDSGHISVIGLSLGLLAAVVLVAGAIVFYIMYRRRNMLTSVPKEEEEIPMVSLENQPDKVTEGFQEFLLDKVNDMYPNIFDKCYFVPPVYVNKNQYFKILVVDQVLYMPDTPDNKDILYDRAMQHVIHCLRHMAEQYQEQMFVLTQFSYDDYLRCPSPEYTEHRLPVPGGLAGVTRDQDIGYFDVLIIHRHHGVVVGVVKTVSDKDDGSENGQQRTDELLISEVHEGMRQLHRAESMIQHLMSDMRPIPVVRLALMLPNIIKSTLRRAVDRTSKGKEDKNMETTIELCVCADHLSHPLRPWDVHSGVMRVFRQWWHQLMSSAVPSMSDGMYRDMISRFCGPATVSFFKIKDVKPSQLPKTLNEAVMLTGDLFERLTLNKDIANLLLEPRVCLTGPPGTGKSKTLALVGKKWISEGHTVHLIKTCAERNTHLTKLCKVLLQTSTGHSPASPVKPVKRVFCNIENSREIHKTIKFLISEEKGKTYCALIDEPDVDKGKLTRLQEFLVKLNKKRPDIRVWVAISPPDFNPPGWKVETLNIPFTCPPSVIREASKEAHEALFFTNSELLPTDGLPVKNMYHTGQGHTEKEPRDCDACGQVIVRFFTRDLRVVTQGKSLYLCNTFNATEYQQATSLQTTSRQSPSVQWKDVLLLFEKNVTEDSPMIQLLKKSGIPVQVINSKEIEKLQMTKVEDENVIFAGNISFPFFRKRKVVVYVEGNVDRSTPSVKSNRPLSITRCSSQLIVVRMP